MRFSHNFGSFHPTVTVDGTTLTFEDFKALPVEARMALRETAVTRCVEANRREKDWTKIVGNTYPAAVHDIITVWESKVETDKEKLARYLANFDWYYEYSDDFRVWSAGNARAAEIRALVGKLGAEGLAMFDAAKPK